MKKEWWKEAVVYQIYPRSFKDSNGDGIGDLKGIEQKVDYLNKLGVDVIWLNPVYESPNIDNGYDISNYKAIMDDFGDMEDWNNLLKTLHQYNIKLIMDLVVNHTSDEHEWFIKSENKKDKYEDYYIWREGNQKQPPNNWDSIFGGSAWEFCEEREEYYLHLFAKKQPDLNWDNPVVRKDVFQMMKWWLDKGIDGFRMDVINLISKPEGLPDGRENLEVTGMEHFANGPRVHDYLQEMNKKVLSNYDIMTVGETPGVTPEEGLKYVAEARNELDMVFQFEHMNIDIGNEGEWQDIKEFDLLEFKEIMSKWQYKMQEGKGWNSLYLNNHDQPRMVSRFGDDGEYREESAKMLATFLHTLQGTPFIYQGEEIGMTNVPFTSMDQIDDVATHGFVQKALNKGMIDDPQEVMDIIRYRTRDNARTPMQWNGEKSAGFTEGEPWLMVNPNYKEINVKDSLKNKDSIFYYYKNLINLREKYPILVYGDYQLILEENENIYSYFREYKDKKLLVILNFFEKPTQFQYQISREKEELLISNYEVKDNKINNIKLRPYEARVYLLK